MNKDFNHRIELKPLGQFFFANERSFVEADTQKTNYFAKTRYYPQQTTILGTIRYALGSRKNFDISEIGKESFHIEHAESYGIIDHISPVFIETKFGLQYPRGVLFHMDSRTNSIIVLNPEKVEQEQKINIFLDRSHYDLKKEVYHQLGVNTMGFTHESNLFEKNIKTGNDAKASKVENTEGLFKQEFLSLKDDGKFVLYAKFKKRRNFQSIVKMGGDSSMFSIDIRPIEENDSFHPPLAMTSESNQIEKGHNYLAIVLSSDAYVKENFRDILVGGVYDIDTFRYLKTKNERDFRYAQVGEDNKQTKKSMLYQVIKRGGILFIPSSEKENFLKKINIEPMQQIGYNYYYVIPLNL